MNVERIKEIQEGTAYPESVSVQQALFQVWNECGREQDISGKDCWCNPEVIEFTKEHTK